MRCGEEAAPGFMAVAGVSAGGVVYAALCGLGFLSALSALPMLYWIVKVVGAAYLAVIGALMLRDALRRRAARPPRPWSRRRPPRSARGC